MFSGRELRLPALLLGLGLAACGGGEDGDSAAIDGGGDVDGGVGGVDGSAISTCDRDGFVPASQSATRLEWGVYTEAATAAEPAADVLVVGHYFDFGGTDGPHTVALTGENYATCGDCVLLQAGCIDGECEKVFLAQSGTLAVTAMGDVGTTYRATLTDLEAAEVTIDDSTESTIVAGGQRWCVDSVTVEAEIVEGAEQDPPPPPPP